MKSTVSPTDCKDLFKKKGCDFGLYINKGKAEKAFLTKKEQRSSVLKPL